MRPKPVGVALALALGLVGCVPTADVRKDPGAGTRSETGTDTAAEGAGGQTTAVVSTVSEDYAVGALATVDLDTWTVSDELVDTTGDTVVRASGGMVFHLNRFTYDTLQVYAPGSWSAPELEVALADGANPHDVQMCDGEAVVVQYGRAELAVYSPTSGLLTGVVDLSAFADGDGTPEASTMVKADNGRLYVGMQNLDRTAGWVSVGGAVAEIDCAARAVAHSWDFHDADVYADLADPSVVYVHEAGVGIHRLDVATGTAELRVDAAMIGADIVGMAVFDGRAVVATATETGAGVYAIGCLDLNARTVDDMQEVDSYLISVDGNARGEAWISARTHWSSPGAPTGLRVFDITTCSEMTSSGPISTVLAPFGAAFY